jgi:hypothetical protein
MISIAAATGKPFHIVLWTRSVNKKLIHCIWSPDYPESWNSANYLYDTKESCCKAFFHLQGKDCLLKESCSGISVTIAPPTKGPTNSPTKESCESRPFHPTTDFRTCTNSPNYPESWGWDSMKDQYLFDTKEACCEVQFFVQNKDCEVEDYCTQTFTTLKPSPEEPCESQLWHPATDFRSCTNR